ncbi:MAG: autoinducer binding domain-containing protein [Jannaschia sp.]
MLETLIPNLDDELVKLREIGPAGFLIGFNYTFRGPEMMVSGYPEDWRAEYEERNYFMGDPVLMWMSMNSGTRRWSDIKLPDVRGVLKRAEEKGLRYGLALSVKKGRKRSICSVARSDRELTDAEISHVSAKFGVWCDLTTNRSALTDKELDVLRLLRNGLPQKEIAHSLKVSEATVKQRAASATSKLGAANRIQAIAIAMTRGYLE